LMSMYLSILSRVLLSSHDVFTRVLTTLAQVHNETDEAVLGKILTVWLSKMPMVSQLEQRKLLGTTLIPTTFATLSRCRFSSDEFVDDAEQTRL
jgi:hypothetical protein